VTMVVVASDGGRPSTVVVVASDGGRPSTVAPSATTAATATAVARFKRSKILTHCFSILDRICWTVF